MSRILSISTWIPFVASLAFIYSSEALSTNGRVLNFVLHRRQSNHQDKANANISLDGGFWFADVTVGDSDTPLELLLDTGSADLVLNPGLYTGGPTAVNLQNTFDITYGTTGNSAGSSSQTLTGSIYNDTVQLSSFKLESQTIGVVVSNGSNSSSSSVYPHDGIIGFGDESFSSTNTTPFFHNLCQQNLVEECRFGLALGLNGTGSLTLGGVSDIVPGGEQSLTKVPIIQEWFVTGDLAVGEKIIQINLIIEFDSGSSAITGYLTCSVWTHRSSLRSIQCNRNPISPTTFRFRRHFGRLFPLLKAAYSGIQPAFRKQHLQRRVQHHEHQPSKQDFQHPGCVMVYGPRRRRGQKLQLCHLRIRLCEGAWAMGGGTRTRRLDLQYKQFFKHFLVSAEQANESICGEYQCRMHRIATFAEQSLGDIHGLGIDRG
ncbi:Plasmepsin-2 [Lachnellula cervina]|uniref:Plasmepsin-2 n=1 Tax=Lachnellula cervina TaxID=1316786 RepID=A0A7D8UNJ0_9HELO|nr:Plasmepsin-2 [Lachnellula cervina]